MEHVWQWFWQLDTRRSIGFTAGSISWSDLYSWVVLSMVRPHPWEIEAIMQMDVVRVSQLNNPSSAQLVSPRQLMRGLKSKVSGRGRRR